MSAPSDPPGGEGWRAREATGRYPTTIGIVWERDAGGVFQIAMRCTEEHDNGNGAMHGGIIASLADMGLGGLVRRHRNPDGETGPGKVLSATIQLDISYASAALIGELVESRAEITHATRSMTFASGRLVVGERTVAAMQGIFKIVGRRAGT
ncbi:PaaI family thioesterase [Pseudoroseicyclus sp. CXY001]|uniref:PaaI family thioesterase n=1 Tax=Pseudoroseicyclus sp. CXY001 TaxID=3242492 RepID=UPI00358DBE88